MILYPAIDLKDGQCVRLVRGDMEAATVFNDSPADQARQFAGAGATWLHVVDLNGAFAGRPVNADAVSQILSATGMSVQLGGGIRTLAQVDAWLEAGVARVIIGTAAVKDPDMVRAACDAHPGRIAVAVDARGGLVAVEGWAQATELSVVELAGRFEDAGVAAIIYTDIDRDGVLEGANVEATAALARSTSLPVIASGGVSSLEDLRRLDEEADVSGAIIGRALYDGRISLQTALASFQVEPC